jgi:flavin-binding protein dodecin
VSSYAEGPSLPIVKRIDMVGESLHSWEDAAHEVIAEAQKTLRGILRVVMRDFDVHMHDHNALFRVRAAVFFRLEGDSSPDYPMGSSDGGTARRQER